MIKKLSAFLLMFMLPGAAFSAIGNIDTRRVVGWLPDKKPSYVDKNTKNDWNTDKYNKIVFIVLPGVYGDWAGTGTWISPRHILTAEHVVTEEKDNNRKCGIDGKPDCDVYLSDGTTLKAKTVIYDSEIGGKVKDDKYAYDWAFLEVSNSTYCNKHYYDGYVPTVVGNGLWRAGFGGLRVLTNTDIQNIKTAYKEFLNDIDDKIKKHIPITQNASFAYDMQDGLDAEETVYVTAARESSVFLDKFKELTHSDFVNDYLNDNYTLKYTENCRIDSIKEPGLVEHDCYSWSGDSGSSIIDAASNKIISIDVGGSLYIAAPNYIFDTGVKTQRIFNTDVLTKIDEAKQQCSNNQTPIVVDEPVTVPTKIITLNKNGGTGIIKNNTGTTFTETNDGEISCTSENTVNLPTWLSGVNSNNTTNITKGTETDSKVFLGWSTKSTCATSICATTSITCPASNTTYYAVWGTPQCSAVHGTAVIATTLENKPSCTVICDNGYKTSGTYRGAANQLNESYTCSGNTISLIWTNGGHGSAPTSPASCVYGENVTTPAALTEEGWKFNNWKIGNNTFNASTSIACNYTNFGVYSGSATLTATWTQNTVVIIPEPSVPSTPITIITPEIPMQPVTDETDTYDTSSDVFNDIDRIMRRYNMNESSSWVNDGSFNTTRLISDSVSGVVLGTVGSVVTSVIIKKNQTKQGFESLKCTIGGQSVATYGDEFKVGVKE